MKLSLTGHRVDILRERSVYGQHKSSHRLLSRAWPVKQEFDSAHRCEPESLGDPRLSKRKAVYGKFSDLQLAPFCIVHNHFFLVQLYFLVSS